VLEKIDLSIVAKLIDKDIKPIGRWVLIRRDPVNAATGGIILPDSATYRSQMATVVNAGDQSGLKAGDRVMYHNKALVILDFDFLAQYVTEGDPSDYCLIASNDLYAVIAA
jgi:co-chaperonin GroES (HSP10)